MRGRYLPCAARAGIAADDAFHHLVDLDPVIASATSASLGLPKGKRALLTLMYSASTSMMLSRHRGVMRVRSLALVVESGHDGYSA